MNQLFEIGGLRFRVEAEGDFPVPEHFRLFAVSEGTAEYRYRLHTVPALPAPEGDCVARRPDLLVFREGALERRLTGVKGRSTPYALYHEVSEEAAEVWALEGEPLLGCDPAFTGLLALERRMIGRGALVLHCAYTVYQGEAILFSAPSETGKSTQAGLWERHRGSRTVNGDRSLLRRVDGRWTACGWPVCGSSDVCHLGDTPIRAVVMLRQGKVNTVERLSPMRAFGQLYSQITVNQWNPDFVRAAMDGIEDLVRSVPVWQLTCDISEGAVRALEAALYPGEK